MSQTEAISVIQSIYIIRLFACQLCDSEKYPRRSACSFKINSCSYLINTNPFWGKKYQYIAYTLLWIEIEIKNSNKIPSHSSLIAIYDIFISSIKICICNYKLVRVRIRIQSLNIIYWYRPHTKTFGFLFCNLKILRHRPSRENKYQENMIKKMT